MCTARQLLMQLGESMHSGVLSVFRLWWTMPHKGDLQQEKKKKKKGDVLRMYFGPDGKTNKTGSCVPCVMREPCCCDPWVSAWQVYMSGGLWHCRAATLCAPLCTHALCSTALLVLRLTSAAVDHVAAATSRTCRARTQWFFRRDRLVRRGLVPLL
jgi:hypothetical protein